MSDDSVQERLGVYISVPFCRAKCSFCNFASGVSNDAAIAAYVQSLCAEIGEAGATAAKAGGLLPRVVDTVYFGGGTPSLLQPDQLRAIFSALGGEFSLAESAEITLEAAPGQIGGMLLEEAMRCGVNRVSLGVQSFVDAECAAVGRSHTGASCAAEIERLRVCGVQEVAADLIAGLPLQTETSWRTTLQRAAEVRATHWSVYMFECDEDSRLGREVLGGGARLHAPAVPSDDAAACMYEEACAWMEEHGFPQYEISNFAGNPHQSRHNMKYWERKPYAGFGLDAHSMLRAEGVDGCAVRFANADALEHYGPECWGGEPTAVSLETAEEERLFLGLRLREGVCAEGSDGVRAVVRAMVAAGLMMEDGERWRLSPRGRMLSNEVFERLLGAEGSR